MPLWKTTPDLAIIAKFTNNTAAAHMGIEITKIGDDFISGRMPVDHRTHQPMGLLHGGASILFAETLGSVAAQFAAGDGFYCVGQEVNGNHLRGVSEGWVYGKATAFHIGRRSQVWSIEITDEQGKMVCISRLTVAVLPKPKS